MFSFRSTPALPVRAVDQNGNTIKLVLKANSEYAQHCQFWLDLFTLLLNLDIQPSESVENFCNQTVTLDYMFMI